MFPTFKDVYDDGGLLLADALSEMPPTLKTAQMLEAPQLRQMPDRLFALVMEDGDQRLRKLATHDPAHTVTSIYYFLQQGHQLPPEVQKVAAHNLVVACNEHDLEPPAELVKVAVIGAVLNGVGAGLGVLDLAKKVKTGLGNVKSVMGSGGAGALKMAEVRGTSVMPLGPMKLLKKKAEEASGWLGPVKVGQVPRQPEVNTFNYALNGRYPLDTSEQVKQASAYFEEYAADMRPQDRHQFANALTKSAQGFDVEVGPRAREYGGEPSCRYLKSEIALRKYAADPQYLEAYTAIENAEASPQEIVEALTVVDTAAGIKLGWGTRFRDPYNIVYAQKTAAEPWSWSGDGTYVSDVQLQEFQRTRSKEVEHLFGKDFCKDFSRDPVSMFKSLPDPQKTLLARMASATARI